MHQQPKLRHDDRLSAIKYTGLYSHAACWCKKRLRECTLLNGITTSPLTLQLRQQCHTNTTPPPCCQRNESPSDNPCYHAYNPFSKHALHVWGPCTLWYFASSLLPLPLINSFSGCTPPHSLTFVGDYMYKFYKSIMTRIGCTPVVNAWPDNLLYL
jgi:hypothetical protein